MSTPIPAAPEYGVGGDHAAARRGRRAFRFCVAFCVALTLVLWFSENYLRYDKSESQYRMSLTHEDPSARPILRNVVKRDADRNASPRAQYLEALAAVEEDDLVLARYDQAYRLNPNDPFLSINYGCRLFLAGHFREARERFREAGIHPPKNALPHYLEAAALAASAAADHNLSEAIALIVRANNSGDPIVFPEPLWHASLPTGNDWYVRQERRVVDLCTAPLLRLRSIVLEEAAISLESGQAQDWDSWLDKLQVMGARLLGDLQTPIEQIPSARAIAAIRIQLDSLEMRNNLARRFHNAPRPDLEQQHALLAQALDTLTRFDASRQQGVESLAERYTRPLFLVLKGLLFLLVVYLLSVLVVRFVDRRRSTWALSHGLAAVLMLVLGAVGLLAVLTLFAMLQRHGAPAGLALSRLTQVWYAILVVLVVAGLIYPVLHLPRAETLAERLEVYDDAGMALRELKRLRRRAAVSLARRYYGLLLGIFLCVLSVWVLGYRISESLYPFQVKLLVPGLRSEEHQVVRSIQEQLSHASVP
ncbi:MAG: hypothetical protein HYV26_20540 [Candidatus Hydrogenedentes bacterium]|nr:hypothetical protein [Candidatus Hydrogenedentota bacterium]MBI3119594.1 hypothetical protein [Candidatus Hydrogenedentota bacterium]